MNIKIAFSATTGPGTELTTLAANAREWGYDGVELNGLANLTEQDAKAAGQTLADAGQAVAAVASGVALDYADNTTMDTRKAQIRAAIRLAGILGSGFTIVRAGSLLRGRNRERALEGLSAALRDLADDAGRNDVTLLLENGGDFATHRDLWQLWDTVASPSLRLCWNTIIGHQAGDVASVTFKALAASTSMIHLGGARFDTLARATEYTPLDQGDHDIPYLIELLKGTNFDGWACAHWPDAPEGTELSPGPKETVLPAAAAFLRAQREKEVVVLAAYKGDKNAPRFVAAPDEPAAPADE